eukprot:632530-Pyramimonas_sp.AAC.2
MLIREVIWARFDATPAPKGSKRAPSGEPVHRVASHKAERGRWHPCRHGLRGGVGTNLSSFGTSRPLLTPPDLPLAPVCTPRAGLEGGLARLRPPHDRSVVCIGWE